MANTPAIARYRGWYRRLLRFYAQPYRKRFAEGMEQTFTDLCRERAATGDRLFGLVVWLFAETLAAIVRENVRCLIMQNKALLRIAIVTASVLALPLIAMQFTDEVAWGLGDFVIGGALLFGAGVTYELVASKGGTVAYRAAVGVAVAAALLLIWVNLAVGLIGSEDNPANLMYVGVLAVAFIGTFIARFQPREMARTLFATALAQALVPFIAMAIWRPEITAGLVGVITLNGFFVALWVVSALLFRHAEQVARQ